MGLSIVVLSLKLFCRPMISSQVFNFNPFQENTYVLFNDDHKAIIIDPGCSNSDEENQLSAFISNNGLNVVEVWLTHAHIDHVLGLHFCLKKWHVPYRIHSLEVSQLKAVEVYAPNYGFANFQPPVGDFIIQGEGEVLIGEEIFRVLFVPGHAPGHVAFFHPESGRIWAGDVLFQSSIGRTDLPGGDFNTLAHSIRTQLYILPEGTVVLPGHGPETTIGFERQFNSFVRA